MTDQHFDAKLAQQLDALEKSRMPRRDLWPGIEHALADESASKQHQAEGRQGFTPRVIAMAASVAFIGVFSWFMWNAEPIVADGPETQDLVAALVEQHQSQRDALLVKFEDQPSLTENWQQQLDELDEAAVAIKKALEQEPNNLALLKMLQHVHQQQIDLIERVHSPKWRQI